MSKKWMVTLILAVLAFAGTAVAGPMSASAFLLGANYIQSGSVTNNSAGLNIVQVIYSLGTPADGIATWEIYTEAPSGFVRSDWLLDADHYQTISWSGLSVLPGGTFSFSGLDIDYITTLVPLNVTGGYLDDIGTSLANASLTVIFNDGSHASSALVQQAWHLDQNLTLGPQTSAVPEPTSLLLLGAGLCGTALAAYRRRK
jgi:hypothetical protein